MNEVEFRIQWEKDKPVYEAWGDYVVNTITLELKQKDKDLDSFFKIPPKYRLKDDESLVDKAFYRPNKNYSDPYNEIEDKVGARFVVLLLNDIEEICGIIESNESWEYDACKHFDDDKKRDPLLFTYQSVHYILRPKIEINKDDIVIPKSATCELQIRTLLQHAHSELTHDAVYKAKKTVQPEVHRTVAKCVALIETTDDFFTEVTEFLSHGPLEEHGIVDRLDSIYLSLTGMNPHSQKSSIVIWDAFEQLLDANLIGEIQAMLVDPDYGVIPSIIREKYAQNVFYHQSVILFIYWMLVNRKQRLLKDWPFQEELLQPFSVDLGISIFDDS